MADLSPYPASDPDTSDDTNGGPDHVSAPRAPYWVKVFGRALLILVPVAVVGIVTGGMGPGPHHLQPGGLGGEPPPAGLAGLPDLLAVLVVATVVGVLVSRRVTLTPHLRKFVLTAHIVSTLGWVGAVVAYLALAVAALTSTDTQTLHTAWIAMDLIGWSVIVPLAIASLLIGLVQSLGTPWGLFRHYWILVKFALTAFATIVLLLHMPTVSYFAGIAAGTDSANILDGLRAGLPGELVHGGGGLLVLVAATTLSVYRPTGVTTYGWRKQREQRSLVRQRAAQAALESQEKQ